MITSGTTLLSQNTAGTPITVLNFPTGQITEVGEMRLFNNAAQAQLFSIDGGNTWAFFPGANNPGGGETILRGIAVTGPVLVTNFTGGTLATGIAGYAY